MPRFRINLAMTYCFAGVKNKNGDIKIITYEKACFMCHRLYNKWIPCAKDFPECRKLINLISLCFQTNETHVSRKKPVESESGS